MVQLSNRVPPLNRFIFFFRCAMFFFRTEQHFSAGCLRNEFEFKQLPRLNIQLLPFGILFFQTWCGSLRHLVEMKQARKNNAEKNERVT